jgi:adenylate kinase
MTAAVVVLMGAPGSGKGTQAKLLASKNPGWVHISTGDLFRREISSGSALGTSIKEILAQGKLVSDDVTNEVFRSQVNQILNGSKPSLLILDGYPRTENQAHFLVEFCKNSQGKLLSPKIIEMQIDEEIVVKRLADRLVNPRTGRIYHRILNPPKVAGICDDDGQALIQRPDDQPETIRARYKLYNKERNGIVRGLQAASEVTKVNADASPDLVSQKLDQVISGIVRST